MPNTMNDDIAETGAADSAGVVPRVEPIPAAASERSPDATDQPGAAETGVISVLKNKIFGAITRSSAG